MPRQRGENQAAINLMSRFLHQYHQRAPIDPIFISTSESHQEAPPHLRGQLTDFHSMTPKRWALIKLMAGDGSMAMRELARRTKRDVRTVHSGIHILLRAGILEKASERRRVFAGLSARVNAAPAANAASPHICRVLLAVFILLMAIPSPVSPRTTGIAAFGGLQQAAHRAQAQSKNACKGPWMH